MIHKKKSKRSQSYASVEREMAKPRMSKSARAAEPVAVEPIGLIGRKRNINHRRAAS
jgi:hypothetical protein